jgi:hypothetical protein
MDEKPATAEPEKKARRRWYQFGLRTLVLGVTLAGVVCAGAVKLERLVAEAREKALLARIVAEVNHRLDVACSSMANDPVEVREDLMVLREQVIQAPELPADTRATMRQRIESEIQLVNNLLRQ